MSRKWVVSMGVVVVLLAPARSGWSTPEVVGDPGSRALRLELNFRYPPSTKDLENLRPQLLRTQRLLCDTTDGLIDVREFRVTIGDGQKENGDVWLFPDVSRSESQLHGGHVSMFRDFVIGRNETKPGVKDGGALYAGQTLAHELGHLLFGLGDSYPEVLRGGTGCGIGPSFSGRMGEPAVSARDNSLMQDSLQLCRIKDGQVPSEINARWIDVGCADPTDCDLISCTEPGCTNPKMECSETPALASEYSIGEQGNPAGNFDLLRGTGGQCPAIQPATDIFVDAAFDDSDPLPGGAVSCGDGKFEKDRGEECDPTDPASPPLPACSVFGLSPGGSSASVGCGHNCKFDKTTCSAGKLDACALAAGTPEFCNADLPPDKQDCTTYGLGPGTVRCDRSICSFDFSGCATPTTCGTVTPGSTRPDAQEQCDLAGRNGRGFTVPGQSCSAWFGPTVAATHPKCTVGCKFDKASCLANPCTTTAGKPQACALATVPDPDNSCGTGYPAASKPTCTSNNAVTRCSIDYSLCGDGASPFNPTSAETALFTSNAASNSLQVIDRRGLVEPVAGNRGPSLHLVDLYAKHAAANSWDVFALGQGEEYEGGTKGTPVLAARFRLTFDPATKKVTQVNGANGTTAALVLGGDRSTTPLPGTNPPLFEGTGAFKGLTAAQALTVTIHFDAVVQDLINNFDGQLFLHSLFFNDTRVLAANGRPQQALCTQPGWCAATFNGTTGNYEGTDQTLRALDDSSFTAWIASITKNNQGRQTPAPIPAFPAGDWNLMAMTVGDRWNGLLPPVVLPRDRPDPGVPPGRNCGAPLQVNVDVPGDPDAVSIVIDRSGSMITPVDAQKTFDKGTGETRLAFAQAAARGFLDLVLLRTGPKPRVGLASFNDVAVTDVPVSEVLDTGTPGAGQITVAAFKAKIAALTSGGNTSIGRGLAEAEKQLDPVVANSKMAILLSDGENNQPTDPKDPNFSPTKVRDRLRGKSAPLKPITIFTVPTGRAADKILMQQLATSGQSLKAEAGDELPPVYAEALVRFEGDALVLPRTPVELAETFPFPSEGDCGDEFEEISDPVAASFVGAPDRTICRRIKDLFGNPLPVLDSSRTLKVTVEQGANALNVMLSTRNAVGRPWGPRFRLRDPAGNVVLDDHSANVVSDLFYRILNVPGPAAGLWTLEMATVGGTPNEQFSYVLAHVENPTPGCLTRVETPIVASGSDALVYAQAHHGRVLASGASYVGRLLRPDGTERPITFGPLGPSGEVFSVIPASLLAGRGTYEVRVTCSVVQDARFSVGEAGKVGIDDASSGPSGVPAFVREAQTSFFVNSTTQPALPPGGDCNNNGVPDSLEPSGDRDGDGLPDVCDDDPKGDDNPRPPNGDPSCSGADCPLASAGPDELLECAGAGATTVQLDGTGSHDPGGRPLTFAWTAPPVPLMNANQAIATGAFPIGTTVASLTVSNGVRTSSDSAAITVLDLVPPLLTVPADVSASSCSVPAIGTAQAVDTCGGAVTLVNDAPPHFPIGTTVVNWFAIDRFGNVSSKTQRVTVNVVTASTISVPADVRVTSCSVPSIGSATARDACGVALTTTSNAPARFPVGTTTVTWSATDNAGRTITRAQKVTIAPATSTNPTLTVPPDINVTTCIVPALGAAVATDVCGAAVPVTSNRPARFPLGTTTITWKATDNAGHSTSKTQKVTIALFPAAAPPFLSAPADVTISVCSNAPLGTPVAFDDCQVPLPVTSNAPAKFPLGTTVVTWKATDALGHATSKTQRVTAELGDDSSCCPSGTHIILGTAASDVISGTSGADCILGRGGDDVIVGNAGNDFISGGAGRDTINAGDGNDVSYGGDGDDRIDSGSGDDRTFGGAGDDTINAGLGSDFVDAGPGTDLCSVAPGGTDTVISCEVRSALSTLVQ